MTTYEKEKMITFLLLSANINDAGIATISRIDVPYFGLSENEIMKQLYQLEKEEYIKILAKSVHHDLSRYAEVELFPKCTNYFENKEKQKKQERHAKWDRVFSRVAIILSIFALLLSGFSVWLQHSEKILEYFHFGDFHQKYPQVENSEEVARP